MILIADEPKTIVATKKVTEALVEAIPIGRSSTKEGEMPEVVDVSTVALEDPIVQGTVVRDRSPL